eukprot:359622-Chlamydomonas_euryale.AAC.3
MHAMSEAHLRRPGGEAAPHAEQTHGMRLHTRMNIAGLPHAGPLHVHAWSWDKHLQICMVKLDIPSIRRFWNRMCVSMQQSERRGDRPVTSGGLESIG